MKTLEINPREVLCYTQASSGYLFIYFFYLNIQLLKHKEDLMALLLCNNMQGDELNPLLPERGSYLIEGFSY